MSDSARAAGSVRIRDAIPADVDWLCACGLAMARETEDKALTPDTLYAGVSAGLADPRRARYFIAMHDVAAGADTLGMPVGTLMLTGEWSDWRNGEWWWIQSVYVLPDQRRRGVFAALYRHVAALAKADSGAIGLRLYAEEDNATAHAAYRSLGMRNAGYRIFEEEWLPQ